MASGAGRAPRRDDDQSEPERPDPHAGARDRRRRQVDGPNDQPDRAPPGAHHDEHGVGPTHALRLALCPACSIATAWDISPQLDHTECRNLTCGVLLRRVPEGGRGSGTLQQQPKLQRSRRALEPLHSAPVRPFLSRPRPVAGSPQPRPRPGPPPPPAHRCPRAGGSRAAWVHPSRGRSRSGLGRRTAGSGSGDGGAA